MKKFNFKTIKNKLILSYTTMGVISVLMVGFTLFQVAVALKTARKMIRIYQPTQSRLFEVSSRLNQSNVALVNYLVQGDESYSKERNQIWDEEISNLIDTLGTLKEQWEIEEDRLTYDFIVSTLGEIKIAQDSIVSLNNSGEASLNLQSYSGYNNDTIIANSDFEDWLKQNAGNSQINDVASSLMYKELIPLTKKVDAELYKLDALNLKYILDDSAVFRVFMKQFQITEVSLMILSILIFVLLYRVIAKHISKSIQRVKNQITILSKGNLPETSESSEDELGVVLDEIGVLTNNLKNVKSFALEVGKGKFENDINVFNDEGEIGSSLAEMRESLKKVAEKDKKRHWVNTGVAHFSDTLRRNFDNLEKLSENIIFDLVKYLKANQGGMFILNDTNESDPYLELMSCYAFERKKFLTKRVNIGEGTIGQCFLEKESIYMLDIPNEYINIRSGLGGANPTCLFLVPLVVNEEVFGVIELASFKEFSKTERTFVETLAENIASAISTVKTNENTKILLRESQQMTEEMRAQEEEMRQNMEELEATQEEMRRNADKTSEKESNLNALINNTDDTIFAIDKEYRITAVNETLIKKYENTMKLEVGAYMNKLITGEQWEKWRVKYDKAMNEGKFSEIEDRSDAGGKKFIHTYYNPILNTQGEVIGASVVSRDITESILKEHEIKERALQLNGIINSTSDSVLLLDKDYKILVMNDVLKERYKGTQYESLSAGQNAIEKLGDVKEEWQEYYDDVFAGENLNFVLKSTVEGEDSFREYFLNPVFGNEKEVIGLTVISRDVTAQTNKMLFMEEEIARLKKSFENNGITKK